MKLIILDRDGVINYDSDDYIKSPDEWIPIPGSLEAIVRLNNAGYTVVVATNQSGIARGLYNEQTLAAIHHKMQHSLTAMGGTIAAIFFCPHHPDQGCDCRKPKSGLFHSIARHFQVSLAGVPAIGDSLRDVQAAVNVGCQPLLVLTGNGKRTLAEQGSLMHIAVFDDLAAAVDKLIS